MNQRRVDMIERMIQTHIKEIRKRGEESKEIVQDIRRNLKTINKTLRWFWIFTNIAVAVLLIAFVVTVWNL